MESVKNNQVFTANVRSKSEPQAIKADKTLWKSVPASSQSMAPSLQPVVTKNNHRDLAERKKEILEFQTPHDPDNEGDEYGCSSVSQTITEADQKDNPELVMSTLAVSQCLPPVLASEEQVKVFTRDILVCDCDTLSEINERNNSVLKRLINATKRGDESIIGMYMDKLAFSSVLVCLSMCMKEVAHKSTEEEYFLFNMLMGESNPAGLDLFMSLYGKYKSNDDREKYLRRLIPREILNNCLECNWQYVYKIFDFLLEALGIVSGFLWAANSFLKIKSGDINPEASRIMVSDSSALVNHLRGGKTDDRNSVAVFLDNESSLQIDCIKMQCGFFIELLELSKK